MVLRCRTLVVRTTLHLDDDVYEAVRSLVAIDRSSVGKVLPRVARRALNPARPATSSKGFPVFDMPPDARPLTLDMVRDAQHGRHDRDHPRPSRRSETGRRQGS